MDALDEVLGRAPGVAHLREQIRQMLARLSPGGRVPPILLEGETGTGKNLVAGVVHRSGPHRDGRFVDVNCAAIPEGLLEAELFGYERGAFTDARQAKAGLFQCADGGTLFLDEIALLSDVLQAKLLKVLEERSVRRLGSTRSESADVSIIAATNADLAAAVRGRRFRQDLYHRLAVVTLRVPPLRERAEDIALLAEHFLARSCRDYGVPAKRLTPAALAALRGYRWPGNVRELANTMERVALLAESADIPPEAVGLPPSDPPRDAQRAEAAPGPSLPARLETLEREELLRALDATRWNVVRAAQRLGITRGTMRYRLVKHGLASPERRARRRDAAPAPVARPSSPDARPPLGARWEPRLVVLLEVTAVAADDAPARAELGRDFDTIVQKVESFAGRVEDASGGRLVAAFGVEPTEAAPRLAALAAMAIRNALVPRLAAGQRIGLRLHADECLVRHVGGRFEIDGDARRRLVATLAEVAADALPGSIVLSAAARSLLAGRFELRGDFLLGHCREPFGVGARRAPFVGRETELATLRACWKQARAGRGQIVALAGEPGIGKSRLLFELRRSLGDTARYLAGHGEAHGRGIPYLPVIEVLRNAFDIDERDNATMAAAKVRGGLRARDPALISDAAPLIALLGAAGTDADWQTLEPAQRRERTLAALKRLVLQMSRERPVLLALEDLHWVDTETHAFLDALGVGLSSARILVVVTSRPEYRHTVGPTSYTQLQLEPLTPTSAEQLARSHLGGDPALEPLTQMLIERTEGNPFFLEESVRALVETGGLVGERGAYRPGPAFHGLDVPPTVRAVLAARIDRLEPVARHVVQAAAVVGKDISLPLLLAVADVPEGTLRRILAELQVAEILRETNVPPDGELSFKHALTREVAYGTFPAEDRRALHARVLAALEHLHADRLPEQADRLARHALAAELWPKALVYCRQAGARAAGRSAHHEAVQYFEQALTAIGRLPQSLAVRQETLDLYLQLRWSLVPLGDYHRLADSLRSAAAAAEGLNDPERVGEISQSMTNFLRLIGDCDGALEAGRRARAIAAELGHRTLEVRATYQLGLVHRQLGDYPRAISALEMVVDALQGELLYERFGEPSVLSVHGRAWLALALADVGRAADGIPLADEAVRIAIEARNSFSQTTAHFSLGTILVHTGDLERGLPILERSLALCRDGNFLLLLPLTASALGGALLQAGRLDEALPLLTLAVETAVAKGLVGSASFPMIRLGHGLLRARRTKEAADVARRTLEAARRHKERGHEAWALQLLGDVAANGDAPDVIAATGHYMEARALARTLGMQPLVVQCQARLDGATLLAP